MLMKPDY